MTANVRSDFSNGLSFNAVLENGTDEPITLTLQLPMFAGQTVKYYTDEAKKPGEIIPNSILKELKVNKKGEAKVTIQPMGGIILM